jgi:CBS domain-containing protein
LDKKRAGSMRGLSPGKEKIMLVGQVMRKDFFVVRNTDVVEEAVKKMREKHVGLALVYEEDHVSGIVTEKEIEKAMAIVPDKSAQIIADAAIKPKPEQTFDDGHRCCYFNDVQIELILNGSKA